jgi:hypothetical protein
MTWEVIDLARSRRDSGGTFPPPKEPAMNLIASPRYLRTVLLADAFSGAGTALLQLTASAWLAGTLGMSQGLLVASGLVLIVFVALAAWLSQCDPVPRGALSWLIAGNWAWAGGCLALLFTGAASTTLGQAYLAVQAIAVAGLAELQWLGIRQTARRAWA